MGRSRKSRAATAEATQFLASLRAKRDVSSSTSNGDPQDLPDPLLSSASERTSPRVSMGAFVDSSSLSSPCPCLSPCPCPSSSVTVSDVDVVVGDVVVGECTESSNDNVQEDTKRNETKQDEHVEETHASMRLVLNTISLEEKQEYANSLAVSLVTEAEDHVDSTMTSSPDRSVVSPIPNEHDSREKDQAGACEASPSVSRLNRSLENLSVKSTSKSPSSMHSRQSRSSSVEQTKKSENDCLLSTFGVRTPSSSRRVGSFGNASRFRDPKPSPGYYVGHGSLLRDAHEVSSLSSNRAKSKIVGANTSFLSSNSSMTGLETDLHSSALNSIPSGVNHPQLRTGSFGSAPQRLPIRSNSPGPIYKPPSDFDKVAQKSSKPTNRPSSAGFCTSSKQRPDYRPITPSHAYLGPDEKSWSPALKRGPMSLSSPRFPKERSKTPGPGAYVEILQEVPKKPFSSGMALGVPRLLLSRSEGSGVFYDVERSYRALRSPVGTHIPRQTSARFDSRVSPSPGKYYDVLRGEAVASKPSVSVANKPIPTVSMD